MMRDPNEARVAELFANARKLSDLEPEAQADLEAMKALLAARAEEPERIALRKEYQAYFDAALDVLRKGAPGLAEPSRVTIARSIALKCQAARKALP